MDRVATPDKKMGPQKRAHQEAGHQGPLPGPAGKPDIV